MDTSISKDHFICLGHSEIIMSAAVSRDENYYRLVTNGLCCSKARNINLEC